MLADERYLEALFLRLPRFDLRDRQFRQGEIRGSLRGLAKLAEGRQSKDSTHSNS